ncbi:MULTISPECIES: LysR family transcriptional regulator [Glutamicibacter]|uniref:LysR family transcriptional regulator n=1 Tax=Glutamicibacter TaxID=1742989 RepID=UPI001484F75C|nr:MULTISPECIES: LysR family transcriptional regulator [Glutamicibacter]
MNYRRLQYFLSTVDYGTVTAAAEELHIAQPALSRQLKTLEQELQLKLFESRGNRLVLTSSGRAFVPLARKLLLQTRDLQEAVAVLRTGDVAKFACGSTSASIRGFLAPFIASLSPRDPMIVVREVSHFDLEQALLHDLDFVVTPQVPSGDLASESLGVVALKASCPPSHPWVSDGRAEVDLRELCSEHLILPTRNSVSRHVLDDALNRHGVHLAQYIECEDGLAISALVASGRGVGVGTELPSFGNRRVAIIESREVQPSVRPTLNLHLAWHRGHYAEERIRDIARRMRPWVERGQLDAGTAPALDMRGE